MSIFAYLGQLWTVDYAVLPDSGLNLRELPNAKSKRLAHLPHNSMVQVLSRNSELEKIDNISDNWCQIRYKALEGWVFCAYIGRYYAKLIGHNILSLLPKDDIKLREQTINPGNEEQPGKYARHLTFYKSGIIMEERKGYEYSADSYFFPEMNIYEAFIIAKRCRDVFTKISFPGIMINKKTMRFKQDQFETGLLDIEKRDTGTEIRFEGYD